MDVIRKGIKMSPVYGRNCQFYRCQYVTTKEEWRKKVEALYRYSDAKQDQYYPNRFNGGNAGPCGGCYIITCGPYIYAYSIDGYGEDCSEFFGLKRVVEAP